MAVRNILHFPNPRLRLIAQPIQIIDEAIKTLINDMLETMYSDKGVGLAANQIDVQLRIFVMDVSTDHNEPQAFINPEIISRQDIVKMEESCLSVPGVCASVERAKKITVRFIDINGQNQELELENLAAHCVQHEIDHLDGKLFIDYLSPLKKQRIMKKLEKIQPL